MKAISIVNLARKSGYNDVVKERYRVEAMAFLRKLAKKLKLVKGEYEIRYNRGGIAVSGEATLHHDKFYLQFSESGVMWRTCKGQKDYTGGTNRWFVGYAGHGDEDLLVSEINAVLNPPVLD